MNKYLFSKFVYNKNIIIIIYLLTGISSNLNIYQVVLSGYWTENFTGSFKYTILLISRSIVRSRKTVKED